MSLEVLGFIITLIYFLKDFGKKKPGNSILTYTENGKRIKDQWGYLTSIAALKYGIDEKVIIGTIGAESNGNQKAVGKAGEIGLMQLLPVGGALDDYRAENRFYGDPFQPQINIDIGAWYLSRIQAAFPLEDWLDKIQAYNTGIAGYRNGKRFQPKVDNFKKFVTNNVNT